MNNKYKIIEGSNGFDVVHINDDNENESIRMINKNKVYYTLLTENKMELVGIKKEELENQLDAALQRLEMVKRTIPIFPIVLSAVGGFLVLIKIIRPDVLQTDGWKGLPVSVVAGEVIMGTVAIVEHIYSKKEVKMLKEQLKALEKYQEEPIEFFGSNQLEVDLENENETIKKQIDEVVSIHNKRKVKVVKI